MKSYRRLIKFGLKYWRRFLIAIIATWLFSGFYSINLGMFGPFVRLIFIEEAPPEWVQELPEEYSFDITKPFKSIETTAKILMAKLFYKTDPLTGLKNFCLIFIISIVIANIFGFIERYSMATLEQKISRDIRNLMAKKSVLLQFMRFYKYSTGEIISRITNDVETVQVVFNKTITTILRDGITSLVYFIVLFSLSWKLTITAIIILPVTALIINVLGKSLRRRSMRLQQAFANITSTLTEILSGFKIIKAFRAEKNQAKKFESATRHHYIKFERLRRLIAMAPSISEIFGSISVIILLWISAKMIFEGSILPEIVVAFLAIISLSMAPLKRIADAVADYHKGKAPLERIFSFLDEETEDYETNNKIEIKEFKENIKFVDVWFKYNEGEDYALKSINMEIKKGEMVALVGHSGAGKSTVVNLLIKLLKPSKGRIEIDGIDISKITLNSLRELFGIVTQDVFLFNDTVKENIAFGEEKIDINKLENSAKASYSLEFINRLPDGFDSIIGERGNVLSGGEKQRLAIARALYFDPPILILDEATSSLDSESEYLVQQAIENLTTGRTVITIAHRISTVKKADKIFVFENGQIVETGNHQELVEKNGVYTKFYNLQFKD